MHIHTHRWNTDPTATKMLNIIKIHHVANCSTVLPPNETLAITRQLTICHASLNKRQPFTATPELMLVMTLERARISITLVQRNTSANIILANEIQSESSSTFFSLSIHMCTSKLRQHSPAVEDTGGQWISQNR